MCEDRLKCFTEHIRVIIDGGDCNLNRQFITKSTTIFAWLTGKRQTASNYKK
jgi:hypothetical protein